MKGVSCSFVLFLLAASVFSQNFLGDIDINYTFQPEGIEHLNFNGQYGFLLSSLNHDGTIYMCEDGGRCNVWSSGGGQLTGTVGLQVDVPNRLLYAANIFNWPNVTSQASIAAISLENQTLIFNADVTNLGTKGAPKLVNDVCLPDINGSIYATESYQGLIFKVSLSTGNASLFASGKLLAPQDSLGIGANGIELMSYNGTEFLLVGVSGLSQATSPLVKVPLNNPKQMTVVKLDSTDVYGYDGLYYDQNSEILYIVNAQLGLVQKLASSDGWYSATLVDSKALNCPGLPPSTVVHLPDPNFAGSAYALCTDGFSRDGPYQIDNVQFYLVSTFYKYELYYTNSSGCLSCLLVLAICLIFSLVL